MSMNSYRIEFTPLHRASKCGNVQIVQDLIKEGADINLVDWNGYTPLHLASMYSHVLVVTVLIQNGADTNKLDKYGRTPLHWTAERGNTEIAQILIQNSKYVKRPDREIGTPLSIAVEYNHPDIVKLLIEYYVDNYEQKYYPGTDPVSIDSFIHNYTDKTMKLVEGIYTEVVTKSRVLCIMQILFDKQNYYDVDTTYELIQTLLLEGLYEG